MMTKMLSFMQGAAELSLLGCIEVASVVAVVYFIYAKTRAPAIIAGLFPYLNLNLNYRSSLVKINSMSSYITWRSNTKSETKSNFVIAHGLGTQNMLELTPHAGKKPFAKLLDWGAYFPFVAQSVRSKKYLYPQISGIVEKDPVLQRAIKQATEQILSEQKTLRRLNLNKTNFLKKIDKNLNTDDDIVYTNILERQESRAIYILRNMRSTLNNFLLGLTSWILYRLLPCFLSGVVTHTKQIEMLKNASDNAPGVPLIFLPLHRSHLDYILVTFILTNNDIRSPLVAAGNNLQIPVFGGLLRGLGAFFIKRKIDPVVGKKDILYRAVLHLYLQHALKMGHNVEFFIEGGRTRTGKPCMPKGGILSVIVNAFMDRSISDALIVPVSVNYERLVDGNFVREQKGEKKVPETFGKAISGIWKALNSNYGLMRIDFNEPYSIKELVQSYNQVTHDDGQTKVHKPATRKLQHNISTSSLYGTDVVCEEHRNLIDSISRQVVYDCADATAVMSTNALAFLLLTRYREGGIDADIVNSLDALRQTLKNRKYVGFSGDSLHIINYAADLLGTGLVTRSKDDSGNRILRPMPSIESTIELAYYSNMLTPHFALESILMITFHNMLQEQSFTQGESGVVRKRLLETALENCDVFRYEYILNKPTQTLQSRLETKLDDVILKDLLKAHVVDEGKLDNLRRGRPYFDGIDESDDDCENMVEIETIDIFLIKETIAEQRALCEVLAPFSHTYLSVAQCLNILYKNPMLETEFIKFIIADLSNKVKSKSCPYAESISTDSVRNCLKLLEKWSVIEICNDHGLRLLALGALYDTSKESLKAVVQRIAAVTPIYTSDYF